MRWHKECLSDPNSYYISLGFFSPLRNHGNCRSDDVTRGSPSRERERNGEEKKTMKQKQGRSEAGLLENCAISMQRRREGWKCV